MTAQIERALQAEIMLRLRAGAWPVMALPIPNSIWIPARTEAERRMVARIIARLKVDGMLVPGAPDLAVFLPGGGGGMIELKRPKSRDFLGARAAGRPSAEQAALADRAALLGCRHAYCSSWEEVRGRLVEWGVSAPGAVA